jgi:hypothetical protein
VMLLRPQASGRSARTYAGRHAPSGTGLLWWKASKLEHRPIGRNNLAVSMTKVGRSADGPADSCVRRSAEVHRQPADT